MLIYIKVTTNSLNCLKLKVMSYCMQLRLTHKRRDVNYVVERICCQLKVLLCEAAPSTQRRKQPREKM